MHADVLLYQLFQKGLSLAGVLIVNRHRQGLSCPNQHGKIPGSCQSGVYQVPEKHLEVLRQHRHDHRLKFAAL